MSLDQLISQIATVREQATSIQNEFYQETKAIENNSDLTDEAKRRRIETAHTQTKQQLSDLRAKEAQMVDAKRESLQRSLFGLTVRSDSQILLYRDAQDRAARLTDETAPEAFEQAVMSDDETLQAAIVARAVKSHWRGGILENYSKKHPVAGEFLGDLSQLGQYDSPQTRMSKMTHYLLVRPPSIS